MTAIFSTFENIATKEGKTVGDVIGWSYTDGVWKGSTKIATEVEVINA